MEYCRISIDNKKDWLRERACGLGASDAAAALGLSPWKTNIALWFEKTGQAPAPDLSDNEAVRLGHLLEAPLRDIFAAEHPEYEVEHHPYDILYRSDRPWLRATLDGELFEKSTGRRGVLEIKTSALSSAREWAQWRDKVPTHYYCQVLWQGLATGYDFAWLFAKLKGLDGNSSLRAYFFDFAARGEDLEWVLQGGEKCWKHIEDKTMPSMILNGL